MKTSEMKSSKWLKQEDVPTPIKVTITSLRSAEVGTEDEPKQRWVLKFDGLEKEMVLNQTNIDAIEDHLGNETDDWTDGTMVLYVDPTVSYQGKRVGGLRLRAPKAAAKPVGKKPAPVEVDDFEEPPF